MPLLDKYPNTAGQRPGPHPMRILFLGIPSKPVKCYHSTSWQECDFAWLELDGTCMAARGRSIISWRQALRKGLQALNAVPSKDLLGTLGRYRFGLPCRDRRQANQCERSYLLVASYTISRIIGQQLQRRPFSSSTCYCMSTFCRRVDKQ